MRETEITGLRAHVGPPTARQVFVACADRVDLRRDGGAKHVRRQNFDFRADARQLARGVGCFLNRYLGLDPTPGPRPAGRRADTNLLGKSSDAYRAYKARTPRYGWRF